MFLIRRTCPFCSSRIEHLQINHYGIFRYALKCDKCGFKTKRCVTIAGAKWQLRKMQKKNHKPYKVTKDEKKAYKERKNESK